MFKAVVLFCLVGLAVGTPPVSRSREQIEAFKQYLESTKTDNGYLVPTEESTLANPEETSGKFDGDILLDDFIIEDMVNEYAQGRNAYIWPNTKWPNNVVVYELASGHFTAAQAQAIEAGIRDIERNTCIRFRLRTAQDSNFVRVTGTSSGCFANVGYWGTRGVHTLNLQRTNAVGAGCFRHATIVHEWMHILGFLHMQSTHDRNNYVRIATENLQAGTEHNFEIYSSSMVSNLGIAYDYVSCLHYGPFAFSSNGRATIVALRPHEGTMGQRMYITASDWLRINRHYNCPGAWN